MIEETAERLGLPLVVGVQLQVYCRHPRQLVSLCSLTAVANDPQRFHVPFLHLDAVQDVVITLCDKRGSLQQLQ